MINKCQINFHQAGVVCDVTVCVWVLPSEVATIPQISTSEIFPISASFTSLISSYHLHSVFNVTVVSVFLPL